MMPFPRNPTRRNRNIGTGAQGHGTNNSRVIPTRPNGLHWLNYIGDHILEEREIAGRRIRFIVEKTINGCIHPCSVADVEHALNALPESDFAGLDTFVFRQPTKKQLILTPAWGRLSYYSEISSKKGRPLAKGPAIYLDAVEVDKPIIWRTSLDPDDRRELDRLKEDGHDIRRESRKYVITITASSARNTQLYRTLFHEIGHWFDWLSKVKEPAARGEDYDELERKYFERPRTQREEFAHRYADAQRSSLEKAGKLPF